MQNKRLIDLIKTRAFQKSDTPSFKLTSGKTSKYYFNLKKVTYYPESNILIGEAMLEKILSLNFSLFPKGVGGLTMGADPIAISVSNASFLNTQKKIIEAFSIRKEPKGHGMKLQIEGDMKEGDSVIIIDDVVTTGKSTIRAIEIAREHKLNVLCALAFLDRCEFNGRKNIEACGIDFYSVLTINDFL